MEQNMNLTRLTILDERNNTMPPEELKELNEKNEEEDDIFYHK